jgi:hypothetical protein
VLLGDHGGLDALRAAASVDDEAGAAATDLAARVGAAVEIAEELAARAVSEAALPSALEGAAARGDPACISWVLDVIDRSPSLARRAAWVYATITGVKIEPPLFVRSPTPEPRESHIALHIGDPHDDLPTPIISELRANWAVTRSRFHDGQRYLGGRPLEPVWLHQCLRGGVQPWRAAAALELFHASVEERVFPVLAPGPVQMGLLAKPAT